MYRLDGILVMNTLRMHDLQPDSIRLSCRKMNNPRTVVTQTGRPFRQNPGQSAPIQADQDQSGETNLEQSGPNRVNQSQSVAFENVSYAFQFYKSNYNIQYQPKRIFIYQNRFIVKNL